MEWWKRAPAGAVLAGIYLLLTLTELSLAAAGPLALGGFQLGDTVLVLLFALHLSWAVALLVPRRRLKRSVAGRFFFTPELLLSVSLIVFVFAYVFASNANLSYVQRFIESGGELRLAVDSSAERRRVFLRYFPFIVLDAAVILYGRLRYPSASAASARGVARLVRQWGLPMVLASALLSTIALPSFVSLDGIALLGWIALVPLFVVLRRAPFGRALFYGIVYGTTVTLLSNFWLGTFNLISLQFTTVLHLVFYSIFMPILLLLLRRVRALWVLLFPLAWTAFEYLTAIGFLGYPWGLVAHTQYQFLSLIQVSAVTGVWGVSFLAVFAASVLSECVLTLADRKRIPWGWLTAAGMTLGAVLLGGGLVLAGATERSSSAGSQAEGAETTRVALVQQNSDPRKHDYRETLSTLRRLTDRAMREDPDLVVWSETAFVPNIRRWGAKEPGSSRLARLANDFLRYQESLDTWLVTGNDDYTIQTTEGGEEKRLDYNAAVLFSADGRRRDTYHKIKLVPFTEYFPYKEQLPWVYDLLQDFDVTFWEPGEEYTVLEFPGFSFATPICFEDIFPNHVRQFVTAGADVIVNMSNDYWSLNEVEAQQHFVAGLFRTVENRRPMLRATASGVTAHVNPYGRVLERRPFYSEEYLVRDVPAPPTRTTLYTRYGDWFPLFCIAALVLLWGGSELFTLSKHGKSTGAQRKSSRKRREQEAPSSRGTGGFDPDALARDLEELRRRWQR